jgi:hypothetical protein
MHGPTSIRTIVVRTAPAAATAMAAACLLALPSHGHASQPAKARDAGVDLVEEVEPISLTERQREAQAVRELAFRTLPVYKRLKRAEIAPLLRRELFEDYDQAELDNIVLAYTQLGLLKPADGLLDQLVDAYAAELVAFYDQDDDTVYLIDDLPAPQVMQRIAELHELVHALQDQHFDLASLPLDAKHDTDRANAALALVEGDATLATFDYAAEHARLSLADALRIALATSEPGPATPYLFRREMHFVYFDGLELARALHKEGGWEAINKAFADPPTSTEQVLHFRRKYIDERDEPTPVAVPDCSAVIGEGWVLVADDVLGELYTQVLFRQHLSFLRAGRPSRGWDGDRLHLYRSSDGAGTDCVLVWRSVWDTEQDAQEFENAYRKVLARKLRRPNGGAVTESTPDDGPGWIVTTPKRAAVVIVDETEALIVEAPSVGTARAVAGHVLAAGRHAGKETADKEPKER